MEPSERRITALHPKLFATYNDTTNEWEDLQSWSVSPSNSAVLWHETQIDLSGYAKDSLTYFPQGVGLQDPGIYQFQAGVSSIYSAIGVMDVISSVPMDMAEVSDDWINKNSGPGMIDTNSDYQHIIYGSYRFFTPNLNIRYPSYCQLERSQRFDSGDATAADKLFCYRLIILFALDFDDNTFVNIPATRQIIAGVMAEESEFVYLQRLKRSYELANQV